RLFRLLGFYSWNPSAHRHQDAIRFLAFEFFTLEKSKDTKEPQPNNQRQFDRSQDWAAHNRAKSRCTGVAAVAASDFPHGARHHVSHRKRTEETQISGATEPLHCRRGAPVTEV